MAYISKFTGAEIDDGIEKANSAVDSSYVDGAESRAKSHANSVAGTALSDAKTYADSAAETALGNAKKYTDTETDAALSEAKGFADGEASKALNSANSYTNQKISETKQYADGKAAAALSSAKSYTDSKIPTKLPNPNALTFKGAAIGTYDGSAPLEITIPEGGSGGVSSWNDLTDKPFGDKTIAPILPETAISFDEGGQGILTTPLETSLTAGVTCIVNWNGAEYECVAQPFEFDGIATVVLGNLGALTGGTDTGEPFVFMIFPPETASEMGAYGAVMALDGSAEAVVSVIGEIVTKIPPEYMPEIKIDTAFYVELALHNYVGDLTTGDVGWINNNYYDVIKAIDNGKLVYLRDVDSGRILGTYVSQTYVNDQHMPLWFIGTQTESVHLYEVSDTVQVRRYIISKGKDGEAGHTPVKGVDYWTAADQESIVQQVIAALGTPVFGTVDADNNIILSGNLADGTYTVKYEDGEGNVTEIGTIEQGGPSTFNVPITWFIGTKLSKTTGAVESTTATDYNASDFIELVDGASYVISTANDCYNTMNIVYYNDSNAFVGYQADLWTSRQVDINQGQPASAALVIPAGATKIRLRHYEAATNHGWSTELITLTGTIE